MPLPRTRTLLAITLGVTLVAGCAGATSTPTAQPSGPMTVEVRLLDTLRMEPATLSVKAGRPIHFVVTNSGATDHEFFLGDAAAQMAHGEQMMGQPGMMHDEPSGIGLMPGMMKGLDHTFMTPGTFEAGCHVNDHYSSGMKMVITVEP